MPYSRCGGVAVYYETYGEGPPLVLIHATSFDHRLWTFQIARYSLNFRVIALDMRGHGLSDKPETPFSLRDMADDVVGVCAQEGVKRAIFSGVSVGSGIALLIGLDQPDLVDALVLVGGSSRGAADPAPFIERFTSRDFPANYRATIAGFFAPSFPETPLGRWAFDVFDAGAAKLSGRSIAEVFRARAGCDMSGRLADLRRPTLVVNGEYDVSLSGGRATAANVAGAEHAVIAGTGHCCTIEDPAAFDRAVLPFLARANLLPA